MPALAYCLAAPTASELAMASLLFLPFAHTHADGINACMEAVSLPLCQCLPYHYIVLSAAGWTTSSFR